jgi:type I restriction enzyme S subunit
MRPSWPTPTVLQLQNGGILLVADGNHGEYRSRSDEFSFSGTAFIRAADMANGRLLFETAQKISDKALKRIRKGIGAGGDVLLSHKGTVGKVAFVRGGALAFVCSPQTTFWRSLDTQKLDNRYLY